MLRKVGQDVRELNEEVQPLALVNVEEVDEFTA